MSKSLPSAVAIGIFAVIVRAASADPQVSTPANPVLGPAPRAPIDVSGLPGNVPRKLDSAETLSVNGSSREQVREFYNAVYPASDGFSIDSSADIANCDPGTNSAAFQVAVLLRINWFRAMSGIPAGITFSASEDAADQSAALMMSANNQLAHTEISNSWSCFSESGTNAAALSDLALGVNGPDAITGYMWDYGAENAQVPHRRWILYPQTQVMATGDVPAQPPYAAANATWIYDTNFGGPHPPGTPPFVAWPPPGYAPYQVVYPQWSFGLSNVDFNLASVTMLSNGVPIDVVAQPYSTGWGENTFVWYPSNVDWVSYGSAFPFNGADTVYTVTIIGARDVIGPQTFTYNVTVFDPAVPGADYVPTIISGTNRPSVNENNPYSCTVSANPAVTGYQWVASLTTNGNLADNAQHGLTNFTISPPPICSIITNAPNGSGKCFHLTHTNNVPQLLQFSEVLLPASNSSLKFESLLGYATTNEVARVQFSTNGGGAWVDLYAETGSGGAGNKTFTSHTLSLSNCAGQVTYVRFDYDYSAGSYYSQTASDIGWCLEHILITNVSKLINFTTNMTASTNLNFIPTKTGDWILQTRGIIFGQFGLDWSPPLELAVVTNAAPPVVLLGPPSLNAIQAQIPFTLTQGAGSSFTLLQASQLNGPWTANTSAVLNTLVAGSSFQFTAPFPGATTFFRVLAR
jgi:hypothetical protein